MQHSDEHPSIAGRPSLLSPDQQAEADRHRILSGLENNPEESAGRGRKGFFAWLLAGVAVLALGAGAGLFLVSADEKEIVFAATPPLPAKPAPAVALATDIPVVRGMADDVAAAAILYDGPVIESTAQAAEQKPGPDALADMLAPAVAQAPPATPAVARPAKAKPAARAVKPTAHAVKPARVAAKAPPRKATSGKKKAEAKPAAPIDTDVALLAAVVAHSKSTAPQGTGAATRLRQCKSLGTAAEAMQIRQPRQSPSSSVMDGFVLSSSLGKPRGGHD